MKRFKSLTAFAVAFMLATGSLMANGLSLNSVGVKAAGMGGAYVGYANDVTALYWNPAGLAGQESAVNLFVTDIVPSATYKYDAAGIDTKMLDAHHIAPNIMLNYNMGKLSLAFGIYVPAGLGAEWDGNDLIALTSPPPPNPASAAFKWMSKIAAVNISPAVAYQVSDQFSVGLAVNIYYAMFDLDRGSTYPGQAFASQYNEESTGLGFGATLGLKFDVNEQFSIGATFRSPTTVAMSGDAKWTEAYLGLAPDLKSSFDRDVVFPMWIAGGIAWHATEELTITADAQYTQWSALDVLTADYKDLGSEGEFNLKWIDAVQIRVGGEYFTSEALALRLGYYYDPAPGPDETYNFLFESMSNNVITGGLSWYSNSITVDFFAEYLMGEERTITVQTADNMPGVHQMDIFAFGLGVNWAF